MEMIQLSLQYHAMNPSHLMVDELEHELRIRGLSAVASRSQLERSLRNRLKEEKDQINGPFEWTHEPVENELKVRDEIVAEIRTELEGRRGRKAPDRKDKTRLLHVFFRMERLRKSATEEADLNSLGMIAGDCVKLLNVYYSVTSHLKEVREEELLAINESLNRARENENQIEVDAQQTNLDNENEGRGTNESENGIRSRETGHHRDEER